MSITIDYFFNHNHALPELAENINQWLGCRLSPYEGDTEDWFCFFLGMELSLSEHTYQNDGECNFEDYKFEFGFRIPWAKDDLRGIQLPTMAFIAYVLHRQMKIAGMLVYDTQIILARYEERINTESGSPELYDLLSNHFVNFPIHLGDLQSRLPKRLFYETESEK